jgi:nucleotide-binding universal stress UspA family protein
VLEDRGRPFREAGFDLVAMQRVMHEARSALEAQMERLAGPNVRVASCHLAYQAAPAAILQRAKQTSADLIVVGPHRSQLPGSHLLGTTAQRVVEHSPIPILIARGPLPAELRKVLLPLGEEDVERGLLPAATRWLSRFRRQDRLSNSLRELAEVRVLHVVRTPDQWRDFSPRFIAAIRDSAVLPEVEAQLRLRRGVAWNRAPSEEIARLAESTAVDLIVMGVCGRGPLVHALLGSVSGDVLRSADASVLLFPPQACERQAREQAAVIPFVMRSGTR